jgi:chromosome segregation ATPase
MNNNKSYKCLALAKDLIEFNFIEDFCIVNVESPSSNRTIKLSKKDLLSIKEQIKTAFGKGKGETKKELKERILSLIGANEKLVTEGKELKTSNSKLKTEANEENRKHYTNREELFTQKCTIAALNNQIKNRKTEMELHLEETNILDEKLETCQANFDELFEENKMHRSSLHFQINKAKTPSDALRSAKDWNEIHLKNIKVLNDRLRDCQAKLRESQNYARAKEMSAGFHFQQAETFRKKIGEIDKKMTQFLAELNGLNKQCQKDDSPF